MRLKTSAGWMLGTLMLAGCPTGTDTDGKDSDCFGLECFTPTPTETPDTDPPDTPTPTDTPVDTVPDTPTPTDTPEDTAETDTPPTPTPDTGPVIPTGTTGETGPEPDTDTSGASASTGETGETGETDTVDTDIDAPRTDILSAGDLIITEFNPRPENPSCSSSGEYIEIFNASSDRVWLDDMVLRIGTRTHTVSTAFVLEPGEFAVGQREVLGAVCGYTTEKDFGYGPTLSLGNSGGEIEILNSAGVSLDVVDYSGWSTTRLLLPSRSIQLLQAAVDATANDLEANWCPAADNELLDPSRPLDNDRGDPGVLNTDCFIPPPIDSSDTDDTDDTLDTEVTGNFGVPLDLVAPNSLFITELMLDPVGCSPADDGRYFEIYNNSPQPIDLTGLRIAWGVAPTLQNIAVEYVPGFRTNPGLQPNESVAIIRAGSNCHLAHNGFEFDNALTSFPQALRLHDGSNDLHTMDFNLLPSPAPGASIGFDGDLYSQMVAAINDPLNWCTQVGPLVSGSEGTPNSENSACSLVADTGDTDTDVEIDIPGRDPSDGLDANELAPGEIVITEVNHGGNDCSSESDEYIEVYNASDWPVRLDGLVLDAVLAPQRTINVIPGVTDTDIAPGEYAIISQGQGPYCWAAAVDRIYWVQASGFIAGDFILSNSLHVIDAIDLAGFPPVVGQTSGLNPAAGVPDADLNDDVDLWCYADATIVGGDRGTPNAANDCAPPPDRCADNLISADEAQVGDLVITELMYDPDSCSDAGGQYIEIYSLAPCPMDVADLSIVLGDSTTRALNPVPGAANTVIDPGEYMALYQAASPGSPFCDLATPDVQWPRLRPLSAGFVSLLDGSLVIDTTDFTSFDADEGWAVQLDPAVVSGADPVTDNNVWDNGNWCRGLSTIVPGSDNKGTPGLPNECDLDIELVPTGDSFPDPVVVDGTVGDLEPGHLVITEMLEFANCGSAKGQYIEVYNSTNLVYDLSGLELEINGDTTTVGSTLLIEAGEYLVFARDNADRCAVVGADIDFTYPSNLALNNLGGSDVVILRVPAASTTTGFDQLIDTVDTTPTAAFFWGGPTDGQSRQLDARVIDPTAASLNNNPANWCATDPLPAFNLAGPSADFGTPGGPNNPCIQSSVPFITTFRTTGDSGGVPDTGAPIDTLQPGDLVITEFMVAPTDCEDEPSAEYIEVLNRSGKNVNLDELVLRDSDARYQWTIQAIINDGQRAIIYNTPGQGASRCYPNVPGDVFLQADPLDNIGDSLSLETPSGTVLDAVDFTAWPLSLGRAWELNPATENANANDDVANWCPGVDVINPPGDDRGTPGQLNTGCSATDEDPPGAADVDSLSVGDLVITEMMVNPATPGCTDADAEYFEVLNASTVDINLEGLRISNQFQSQYEFAINTDVVVSPGDYAVLARFANPRCYDLDVAAFYGVVRLDNNGDVLRISNASGVLDVVDFRVGFAAVPEGASWELDEGATDVTSNDDPELWCGALTAIDGGQDLGSPGAANGACYSDTGSINIVDTDDVVDPPVDPGFGLPGTPVADLGVGDLVITEVMVDAYDCPNGQAQYIEILNTTGSRVTLDGLVVTTTGGTHTVTGASTVAAGDYAVGVRADTSPQCYGLVSQFSYTGAPMPNTGGTVSVGNGSVVFDSIDYSSFGTQPVGASWTLQPSVTDATGNDVSTAWCVAGGAIPGAFADRGSPGEANLACSVDPVDTGDGNGDDTDPCLETGDIDACVGNVVPLADLEVGELIISEFFVDPRDCSDNGAEYVELYNNTTDYIDVNGLKLSAGGGVYTVNEVLPLVVAPGDYALAGINAAQSCYGRSPDVPYRIVTFDNEPGLVFIANETTVLDLVDFADFAEIPGRAWGLDPSRLGNAPLGGTADLPVADLEYTGSYANNNAANWCVQYSRIPGAVSDKGTPDAPNDPVCLAAGEVPPYPDDYVAHVDELDGGELVLTEIMARPADCNGLNGEYIEIRNDSDWAVALDGLRVATVGTSQTVSTTTIIQPGEIKLGRRSASTTGCYSGVAADFVYGVAIGDAGELLELRNSHSVLDAIDTTGWNIPNGESLQLDPDSANDATANAEDDWCTSDELIPGATNDVGTPGLPTVCGEVVDTDIEALLVSDLEEGDLIITELHKNDQLCAGNTHQYIEIYNNTDQPVELLGLIIESAGSQGGQVNASTVVQPGDYSLGVANVFSPCLVLDADFFYPGAVYFTQQDVVRLRVNTDLIDEVSMQTIDWEDSTGNAWQLDPAMLDATLNDDVANWCVADGPIVTATNGGTMSGTPGEVNDCTVVGSNDTGDSGTDSGIMRFGEIQGEAVVAAGSLYLGDQDRIIGTRPINGLGSITPDCFWNYEQRAFAVANLANDCPSCEFGFQTRLASPVDVKAQSGLGPSNCGTTFDFIGGVGAGPVSAPAWTIGLSQDYGAVMYQYGGQPFGVLTYVYEYGPPAGFSDPNFRWTSSVYTIYY